MSSQAVYCHGLCLPIKATRWGRRSSSIRPLAVLEKDSALEDKNMLNKYSSRITQPASQGASQAMLYAIGLSEEDLKKPQVESDYCTYGSPKSRFYKLSKCSEFIQIGIASVWYEGNPCNMHLLDLSSDVKEGMKERDIIGLRFNTVGVSDAISMGTEGMSYSLQSRDLIADSVETLVSAQWYDEVLF